jgi:hypothetical protein
MRKIMNLFKLALLIIFSLLVCACNQNKTKQEVPTVKQKEPVILFELPGMDNVIVKKDIPYCNVADSNLKMDIYYPPNYNFSRNIPAIIIIYGCSNEGQLELLGDQFRNWSVHISFCKLIAASGMAAIIYETVDPKNDLISLTEYIKSNHDKLSIDDNKIGAFTSSSNTPVAITNILNRSTNIFKCAVVYYGIFLTKGLEKLPQTDSVFGFQNPRLSEPIDWNKNVPLLIVKAGLDNDPYVIRSILDFYNNAIYQNLPVTFINYPTGQHGFDFLNDNDTTKIIIASTLDFWKFYLKINKNSN